MDFIKEFKNYIQNWRFITIAVIIIGVRGVKNNKGEQQLLMQIEKVNLIKKCLLW
jgi:hypothetical protein